MGGTQVCNLFISTPLRGLLRGIELGQLVQYVSQLDEHSPFLTVRETLMFVARNRCAGCGLLCLAVGRRSLACRHCSLTGVDRAAAEQRVQEILDLLHLNACADTIVGNDLMRGVSGGEKKRVTVGEGLITNARFLALDEISTGKLCREAVARTARLSATHHVFVSSQPDYHMHSSPLPRQV